MTIKKRYNIVRIIYDDLYIYGRLQLFLLLLVFVSAILIVMITYQTRCMVMRQEELFLERRALDIEWNNLLLKEKILSEHGRVEKIAKDMLHMHYIDMTQDDSFVAL